MEVQAAMGGDESALSALWRSHKRWLAAILLSHKPREIDVEDLMQDVAVKLVTKIHTLRDPNAFRPWLRQIAINAARESARSVNRQRNERSSLEPNDIEVANPKIEAAPAVAERQEEGASLLAFAQTLPPDFREPVLLRCVQGLSCKQIAEILQLPVTTIETRLSRGRRMLREEWSRRTSEPDLASTSSTRGTPS